MTALICYDGSADAQAGIDSAAQLMPGTHATVLVETAALDTANAGAKRADAAGLIAESRIAKRDENMAIVILAAASDVEADVIVLGTRGRGDVKSLLLGSVSNAVVHHADRAVLIVPSPALTEERQQADHSRAVAGISSSDRAEKEHHGQHIN